MIGDIAAYANSLDSGQPTEPIAVSVALEGIEALYRHERSAIGIDSAKAHLRAALD